MSGQPASRYGCGPRLTSSSPNSAGAAAPSREAVLRNCETLLPAADHAGIDHRAGARDRVEEHLVADDLRRHERQVRVEALGGDTGRRVDVALAQLTARADDEVGDALLRLHALVEMVVAGEHHA